MMRGDYLTIMSRRQLEVELETGLVVTLPVDLQDSTRVIGMTYRLGWEPTPTQTRFMDLIREEGRKWQHESL